MFVLLVNPASSASLEEADPQLRGWLLLVLVILILGAMFLISLWALRRWRRTLKEPVPPSKGDTGAVDPWAESARRVSPGHSELEGDDP